ncbi:RNA polymerase sigma factor [Mucilaginibacter sp. AW1-3]
MSEQELQNIIRGCVKEDRASQKMLYKTLYGFAMGICLRYAGNRYEAAEILNTGFFKALTNIKKYDDSRPFKAWLGRIMTNTAIDYYRTNLKVAYTEDIETAEDVSVGDTISAKLNYDDLLALVQKLPQAYRTVFNLYAIDGYTHDEIGEILGINPGTSKSNLHKARQKLQQMILGKQNGDTDKPDAPVAVHKMIITDSYIKDILRR